MNTMVAVLTMAGLAMVATSTLWVPTILGILAKKNLFFTEVKEGTAKAITKFGKFHHCVLSYKGHYFNSKWDLIDEARRDKDRDEDVARLKVAKIKLSEGDNEPARTLLVERERLEIAKANLLDGHALDKLLSSEERTQMEYYEPVQESWIDGILPGGLRWVGLPFVYNVHRYSFRWTSLRQGGSPTADAETTEKGEMSIVKEADLIDLFIARDEKIDYVNLTDDTYVLKMERAEDKEMIPLSFRVLVTARVVNVYKALFRTEQWLEMALNTLRPIIKQYVGRKKLQELICEREESLEHEDDEILNLPSSPSAAAATIKNYIRGRWGVQIKKIGIVNVNTAGKAGEAYEDAAAKKYQADREAERIVTIATANAKQVGIAAKAEAKRIKTVMEQMKTQGGDAFVLRATEAFEKAGVDGNTILIGGAQPVQMLLNAAKKPQKEE